MKNIINTISTLLLSVTLFMFTSSNCYATSSNWALDGYYNYYVSNGEATIARVDSAISGNIQIPATLGGYKVVAIGENAFSGCNGIESLIIPHNVNSIGDFAFYECVRLNQVNMSNNIEIVGLSAFANCTNLTDVYYDGYAYEWSNLHVNGLTSQTAIHCKLLDIKSDESVRIVYNTANNTFECLNYYLTTDEDFKWTKLTVDKISGLDINKGNTQTVTITYNNFKQEVEVEIDYYSKIQILTAPKKYYYMQNIEELNTLGGELLVEYESGYLEKVDITAEMVSGFDNKNKGKQRLTVEYGDQFTTFDIEIVDPYYLGDVNNDGAFSVEDSRDLRRYIIGDFNDAHKRSCDFNDDNNLDVCDLILLYKYSNCSETNSFMLCKNAIGNGAFEVCVIDTVENRFRVGEGSDISYIPENYWDPLREIIFNESPNWVYWLNGHDLYFGAGDNYEMIVDEEDGTIYVSIKYMDWIDDSVRVIDYTLALERKNDYVLTVIDKIGDVKYNSKLPQIGDSFVKCMPYTQLI